VAQGVSDELPVLYTLSIPVELWHAPLSRSRRPRLPCPWCTATGGHSPPPPQRPPVADCRNLSHRRCILSSVPLLSVARSLRRARPSTS